MTDIAEVIIIFCAALWFVGIIAGVMALLS
jgi:hypothetical protein